MAILSQVIEAAFRAPNADGWRKLIAMRLGSMRERTILAVCAGLVSWALFDQPLALIWSAVALCAIVFERLYWRRSLVGLDKGAPPIIAVAAGIVVFVATAYGALAALLWPQTALHGDVIAALFLSAVVLSSVVTLRAAPVLALCAIAPSVGYIGILPRLTNAAEPAPAQIATWIAVLFLATFAGSIWFRLAQADRSERTALEAARKAAHDAELAHAAKANFLTGMSRELRTPITMVLGAAAVLRRADLAPAERASVDVMLDAGEVLVAALNDVLDAARIEAGEVGVCLTRASPAMIALRIVQTWRPRAEDKWLELFLDVDANVPTAVMIDPVRVKQVLFCLVSNAVRYTDHGGVRVQVSASPIDADRYRLTFRVSDTGQGLTAARAEAALEGRSSGIGEGSGFGLALCRKLARAMGGDIVAESARGEGSTFSLWLDVAIGADADAPSTLTTRAPATSYGLQVLVIDNHAVSRSFAADLLEELGADVTVAADGGEGLALLNVRPFDLIIADIGAPGASSADIARATRRGDDGPRVPVIAMSADLDAETRRRCIEAGLDGAVGKPVIATELFGEMSRILDAKGRRAA